MPLIDRMKRSLAAWLSPDMAHQADRYYRLRSQAAEAYWWLGEFPDATDTLRWILDGDTDRNRGLDEKPIMQLPSGIWEFREHLRRRSMQPPATLPPPPPVRGIETDERA